MRMIALAVAAGLLVPATASAAPPVNDDFEQAAPLAAVPAALAGTFKDATAQPGEPDHGTQTLWYAFRPTRTERVAFKVTETGPDPQVSVYTGSSLSALELVVRHRGYPARAGFDAVAGQTYLVALGNTSGEATFKLALTAAPLPANDAFADAAPIGIPGEAAGDLADATGELGEEPTQEMEVSTFVLTISDGSIEGKGVTLAVDHGQTVTTLRASGLRMTVATRRRTGVVIDLRVSRRTMRRVGLTSRVLGRTRGTLGYDDSKPAVIRLNRRVRRALARADHLEATVRLELLSKAPNRVLSVPVSL